MRFSNLFSLTLRDTPAEAETTNYQLLLRAGYIRQQAAGIFSVLPLARRALDRLETILREEIEAIGGQEISMPVFHSAEVWKETGRWYQVGAEMGRFKDRAGRDMVMAMTHEEIVASLARDLIRSHRQLPALVYQIQTKWRDDPRPRGGLVRVREFTMLDSYSLDADWEGVERQYQAHYQAYFKIFARCGLPVVAVRSDTGMMGGKIAHEYMYLTPIGEDTLLFCDACGYSANRQVAQFRRPAAPQEAALPLEKVSTPHTTSIEDLAAFLQIPSTRTAKAVFLVATLGERREGEPDLPQELIFAVVRGDMEVNETRLANLVGAVDLRPALEAEIRATGAVPGYASPIGVTQARVIVDDLVAASPNLVAGANQEGFHYLNTNFSRDYPAAQVADIAAAADGYACPQCGAPLRASRGVEVGNIFQLGERYTTALGASFTDENGKNRPILMGSYGIGLGRLLACLAEEHHDDRGLVWPDAVAPYPVHLVRLGSKDGSTERIAEQLYRDLCQAGLEPLFDDRPDSPGVKFNDADLIGLPLRLTVSERALRQGGIEFKRRSGGDAWVVPLEETLNKIRGLSS